MKKLRIWKLLLLGLLLCALCMALSGCIVDPDKNAIPTSTFKKFTPIPDAPTDTPEVVTPTPDPNLNQQSWTAIPPILTPRLMLDRSRRCRAPSSAA